MIEATSEFFQSITSREVVAATGSRGAMCSLSNRILKSAKDTMEERTDSTDAQQIQTLEEVEKRIEMKLARLEAKRKALKAKKKQMIEAQLFIAQTNLNAEEIIEINVGGTLFTTSKRTLCKYPLSKLAWLFDDRNKDKVTRDSHGRYFLDRDPSLFRIVLNFLREEKPCPSRWAKRLPHFVSLYQFERELEYFGLPHGNVEYVTHFKEGKNDGESYSEEDRRGENEGNESSTLEDSTDSHSTEGDSLSVECSVGDFVEVLCWDPILIQLEYGSTIMELDGWYWIHAVVVEISASEDKVKVHYHKFDTKYDEWVSVAANRLRRPVNPANALKLRPGARVEVMVLPGSMGYAGTYIWCPGKVLYSFGANHETMFVVALDNTVIHHTFGHFRVRSSSWTYPPLPDEAPKRANEEEDEEKEGEQEQNVLASVGRSRRRRARRRRRTRRGSSDEDEDEDVDEDDESDSTDGEEDESGSRDGGDNNSHSEGDSDSGFFSEDDDVEQGMDCEYISGNNNLVFS